MKARSLFFVVILCCSISFLRAQELVPNGGFEVYSQCPTGPGQLHFALGWSHATSLASTDLYNQCSTFYPNLWADFQMPHSGQSIAGFFAYDKPNGSMAREFLQIQLNDTLEPGKSYHCKMHLNLRNYCAYAVNSVGMYFTPNAIFSTTVFTVPNPQVQNPVNVFLSDTMNWMLLEDTIVATGGELFLTIGNFHPDSTTDTLRVLPYGWGGDISYYYIDDISVMPLSIGVEEYGSAVTPASIFPNPSSGEISIRKKTNAEGVIEIYNSFGTKQYTEVFPSDAMELKLMLTEWANGIFLLKIKFADGSSSQSTFILSR